MQHGLRNITLGLFIAGVGVIGASAQGTLTSFEVASIKPNATGDHRVSIMTQPGGRFVATGVSLKTLIGFAYGVRDFQILGGPNWLEDDRWDVEAKAQEGSIAVVGPTDSSIPSPVALRLQSLMRDRFRLNVHHDAKELAVYELSIAKGGPKLKLSEDQSAIQPPEPGSPPPRVPQRGEPLPRGSMRVGRGEVEAAGVSLLGLIRALSAQLGANIIDKTRLKGLYNFKLQWIPDMNQGIGPFGRTGPESPPPASDLSGPSIFTAIQEQLGLRLESVKGPVEVIVIDSVQKPSAN
jgi:bla regulator protein BlaR1